MKKVGVIIGRFQVAELHSGHRELISEVFGKSDEVLFILGEARIPLTAKNPLPFESRQQMISDYVFSLAYKDGKPKFKWPFLKIDDCKNNVTWSNNLDKLIADNTKSDDEIVLYTGRDGFNSSYSGKYQVSVIPEKKEHLSGTHYRDIESKNVIHSRDWRSGVIYATQKKYPTSYQATDAAIIKKETGEILLGRKPAESKFRIVGGFVDPTDPSLERASKREVNEECSNIEVDNFRYIGSFRVKDWRFEYEKDKIMTAFFVCNYIFGQAKASDDIAEVKWFKLAEIAQDMIEPEHIPLLMALKEYIEKENEKIALIELVEKSLQEGNPAKNSELISKLEKVLRIVRQPINV